MLTSIVAMHSFSLRFISNRPQQSGYIFFHQRPSVRFRVFLKMLVVLWFWKICVLMYFNTYTPFFKGSCLFFFNQPNFSELSKHLATYGLVSASKCNIIKLQTKWYASHLRTSGDIDPSKLWEVWSKFAIQPGNQEWNISERLYKGACLGNALYLWS